MPDSSLLFLTRKNLIRMVEASIGTELFRNTYVLDKRTGKTIDTTQDGDQSCSYYVSGILTLLMLIDHPHSIVPTTIKKMEEAGWYKIDQPKPGAIVHWPVGRTGHEHLGFYLSENTYVSNSYKSRSPKQHVADWRSSKPDAYYWHPKLDDVAS